MSPVLEQNQNTFNTLPGPVAKIVCQSGQIIVIDPTTKPATTTSLASDEVYNAEGKAGLGIADIDGSRYFVESSLENRTDSQMVDTPGTAQQLTDVHGEPTTAPEEVRGDNDPEDDKQTGSYESRPKAALYELAKERDLDVDSHSSKADLIAALRGE